MKIKVDEKEILELSETKKKVIKNEILSDDFETDMIRRIKYVILYKYEQCFKRLKEEWIDNGRLIKNGVQSIPTDPDALAELIFSQPDYKNRSERESSI